MAEVSWAVLPKEEETNSWQPKLPHEVRGEATSDLSDDSEYDAGEQRGAAAEKDQPGQYEKAIEQWWLSPSTEC